MNRYNIMSLKMWLRKFPSFLILYITYVKNFLVCKAAGTLIIVAMHTKFIMGLEWFPIASPHVAVHVRGYLVAN